MERQSQNLPIAILFVFAPTRVLFDSKFLKAKDVGINFWSWLFLAVNLGFLFWLPWLKTKPCWRPITWTLLWVLPISRIFEIGYAFFNDSIERIARKRLRTKLSRAQRLVLVARSYVEVAICYASLYLMFPKCSFSKVIDGPFTSLYFSWATITTTGFGDYTPLSNVSRLLCMSEIGFGLMLIVFAVGSYFSYAEELDEVENAG